MTTTWHFKEALKCVGPVNLNSRKGQKLANKEISVISLFHHNLAGSP